MKLSVLIISFFVGWTFPSLAAPVISAPISKCDDRLTGIVEYLGEMELQIPQIPPEQNSYLEKETTAAFQQADETRFRRVVASPFFGAWQARKALVKARSTMSSLELAKTSTEGVVLNDAVHRLTAINTLPVDLAELGDAIVDYSVASENQLSHDKVLSLQANAKFMPHVAMGYIQCLTQVLNDSIQ